MATTSRRPSSSRRSPGGSGSGSPDCRTPRPRLATPSPPGPKSWTKPKAPPGQSASRACVGDGIRAYPTTVSTLAPEQARAVAHPPGALLVVGGAGTGKTTVVVERFAHRVGEGAAPESILVLAPTAAAAVGLRERIEDALDAA